MFNIFNTKGNLVHTIKYTKGEGGFSTERTLKFNKKWVALDNWYYKVKDIKPILFYLFNNEKYYIKSYVKSKINSEEQHLVNFHTIKINDVYYTPRQFKNEMPFRIGCHNFYLAELLLFMEKYNEAYGK